jgi:Flp pilus assembly secretin CpaC
MKVQTRKLKHPQKSNIGWLAAWLFMLCVAVPAQTAALAPGKAAAPAVAQVQLQIRVTEVDRRLLRELSLAQGVVLSTVPALVEAGGPGQVERRAELASSPGLSESRQAASSVKLFVGGASGIAGAWAGAWAFASALQARGAIRQLAEPNQLALPNQKASFLAGGEFPIPIIQSDGQGQNTINVLFKEFGIKLNFQAVILDEKHLRLELEPEVASLDFGAGVTLEGLVIPGVRVRRARTVLELRDGQSFALAGLLDSSEQANLAKFSVLGDVPILGELFKSRSFQRNETELLMLITVKVGESRDFEQLSTLPEEPALKPKLPGLAGLTGHATPGKHQALPDETITKDVKRANDISVQFEASSAKPEAKSEKKVNEKP